MKASEVKTAKATKANKVTEIESTAVEIETKVVIMDLVKIKDIKNPLTENPFLGTGYNEDMCPQKALIEKSLFSSILPIYDEFCSIALLNYEKAREQIHQILLDNGFKEKVLEVVSRKGGAKDSAETRVNVVSCLSNGEYHLPKLWEKGTPLYLTQKGIRTASKLDSGNKQSNIITENECKKLSTLLMDLESTAYNSCWGAAIKTQVSPEINDVKEANSQRAQLKAENASIKADLVAVSDELTFANVRNEKMFEAMQSGDLALAMSISKSQNFKELEAVLG
jgi:hypothetical protein